MRNILYTIALLSIASTHYQTHSMSTQSLEHNYEIVASTLAKECKPNAFLDACIKEDQASALNRLHEGEYDINAQEPRFGKLRYLLEPKKTMCTAIKSAAGAPAYQNMPILSLFDEEITQNYSPRISGMTALHYCIVYGLQGVLSSLLKEKTLDPNLGDLPTGNTPLHYAVAMLKEEYVRVLVRHEGCNLYVKNKNHETPLMIAYEIRDALPGKQSYAALRIQNIICILEKWMDKTEVMVINNKPITLIPMSNA